MNFLQLTDALRYGLFGLAAILAIIAGYLLFKEQNKENPRLSMIKSIYVFMVFSIIVLLIGFISQTKDNGNQVHAATSGFAPGALDGRWQIIATDTPVANNTDFKIPTFTYYGYFEIEEENCQLSFSGYLERRKILKDSTEPEGAKEIKFKAKGPLNNNYVGVQYYFIDGKRNGFGTMLARFNNDATTADAYFLFRPSVTNSSFGLVYGRLTRVSD